MSPTSPLRIVVKLGTSTVTGGTAAPSLVHLKGLARQMAALRRNGHVVIVVSSGAIAAGRSVLDAAELPRHVPAKQMLSAVGQPRLMAMWQKAFDPHHVPVAQVLLTAGDLGARDGWLNARNTLTALLDHGVVPVVNENDTVATEEIRVGDNDNLSALVAQLVHADLLVMLTNQAGLYTADPRHDPDARLVHVVDTPEIPAELWKAAAPPADSLGTGGMITKLQAADLARRTGCTVVIANGRERDILRRLIDGDAPGTRFMPTSSAPESRKRFILSGVGRQGTLVVDAGAAGALARGGSLLPVGLTRVDGEFARGDTVAIASSDGHVFARGLTAYDASELRRLVGRRSADIEQVLGYTFGDEIVHRNDMVIL